MKWNEPNESPHGILINGEALVIGQTGEQPKYRWYWTGENHVTVLPGGTVDELTGEIKNADGTTHGWISPLADMPEITDFNAAMGIHGELQETWKADYFQSWMRTRLKEAENQIASEEKKAPI